MTTEERKATTAALVSAMRYITGVTVPDRVFRGAIASAASRVERLRDTQALHALAKKLNYAVRPLAPGEIWEPPSSL